MKQSESIPRVTAPLVYQIVAQSHQLPDELEKKEWKSVRTGLNVFQFQLEKKELTNVRTRLNVLERVHLQKFNV